MRNEHCGLRFNALYQYALISYVGKEHSTQKLNDGLMQL
jgi:hypothetical protein